MSHQTSNVFDTVAENATNANDKFDNVDIVLWYKINSCVI